MAIYNPGAFPTGCRVITINSVTYKSNSESKDTGTQKTNLYDEAGLPMGVILQDDFKSIKLELQLATVSTPVPTTAAVATTTGTFTLDGGTWAIETVSEPREKLGQRTVSITAQLNPS